MLHLCNAVKRKVQFPQTCQLVKLLDLFDGIRAQIEHFQSPQTFEVFNILNINKHLVGNISRISYIIIDSLSFRVCTSRVQNVDA